jgi:hypothetical protein
MYEKYCFDHGWTPKSDYKGRYPKVSEYPKRNNDDMFWESDVEVLDVCSWWSFRELWKEHCPNIRIRRSCNDTCGECIVYKNAFRYRENRKREIQEQDDASDSDGDDDFPGLVNQT